MSKKEKKPREYRGLVDEIREQQKKLKDMTWKQRFEWFFEYYKFHTLAVIVGIFVLISIINTVINHKDNCFYAILLNAASVDSEIMEESFAEYAGMDTEKYECFIDTSSTLSYITPSNMDYATMEKIMAVTQTKDLDVGVFDSQAFRQYAVTQVFQDLRNVLSPEQLERYQDYIYYIDKADIDFINSDEYDGNDPNSTANIYDMELVYEEARKHAHPENMKEPIPVGIYLTESALYKSGIAYQDLIPIYGVGVTTTRPEAAAQFLDYLFDESIPYLDMLANYWG